MDNIEIKIANSIKQARKNAKLSQTTLAEKVGITHASISYWENGVNVPNVKDCWLIANELGISIDELVGKE